MTGRVRRAGGRWRLLAHEALPRGASGQAHHVEIVTAGHRQDRDQQGLGDALSDQHVHAVRAPRHQLARQLRGCLVLGHDVGIEDGETT